MSKRVSTARYPLPLVINPDSRVCFKIEVPNDIYHIGAFLGQIYALSRAFSWGDDPTHKALLAAEVWRDIFDNLRPGCPPEAEGSAGAEGEEQLIRQNPDNPCLLETSIDGTHWCAFADLSLCVPSGSQPGGGAQQPAPGGGQACYHAQMTASNKWLLPTLVNAGDVIQITNAKGAASDGTVVWYCPNGAVFQLGACFGSGSTSGGDPLNTSPHMTLLAKINGVYYNVYNTSLTVPGGVSAASVEFQVNDSNLADNYGDLTWDVCITNNAAATWTHTFDYTVTDGAFAPISVTVGVPGIYTPGVGWTHGDFQSPANNFFRGIIARRSMAARTITGVEMVYDVSGLATNQGGGTIFAGIFDSGGQIVGTAFSAMTNGTGQHLVWNGSRAGATYIQPLLYSSYYGPASNFAGAATVKKLIVSGIGTDPF